MSAKPSAITGTGVENDPYIIHNYDELKWCCEDTDAIPEGQVTTDYVFVLLNNDIDCSTYDGSFRWSITCDHAVDFDLNTKTIQNFYIAPNSYMFTINSSSRKLSIHDGQLLNIYGDWVRTSVSVFNISYASSEVTIQLRNLSLSVDITNFGNITLCYNNPRYLTCTNCTFDFKGSHTTTNSPLIRSSKLYTCDVHVDVTLSSAAFNGFVFGGMSSSSDYAYALNCRFMGELRYNWSLPSGSAHPMMYATIRNCVIDLAVISTSSTSPSNIPFIYSAVGGTTQNYGIYNTEKLPNYTFSGTNYIACTTEDMDMRVNPNADVVLQEKGFDVIKG